MKRIDIEHPPSFKDGVRVLLLMLRAKDGGHARTDRKATIKIITSNPTEFDEALTKLRSYLTGEERIYSTINPRSVAKASRLFQYRVLDANYYAEADRINFYLDLDNRWISCLKDPRASTSQLFLVDCDHDSGWTRENVIKNLWRSGLDDSYVVDHYDTRNGSHVILKPFNPAKVPFEVKKNALMLWSYGSLNEVK